MNKINLEYRRMIARDGMSSIYILARPRKSFEQRFVDGLIFPSALLFAFGFLLYSTNQIDYPSFLVLLLGWIVLSYKSYFSNRYCVRALRISKNEICAIYYDRNVKKYSQGKLSDLRVSIKPFHFSRGGVKYIVFRLRSESFRHFHDSVLHQEVDSLYQSLKRDVDTLSLGHHIKD